MQFFLIHFYCFTGCCMLYSQISMGRVRRWFNANHCYGAQIGNMLRRRKMCKKTSSYRIFVETFKGKIFYQHLNGLVYRSN